MCQIMYSFTDGNIVLAVNVWALRSFMNGPLRTRHFSAYSQPTSTY